jgi:hypothetical protein
VNVGVANVPGPRDERRVLGAPVIGFYSVNLTSDGPGFVCLTVGAFVNFTVITDRDQVPDAWKLVGWAREELAALTNPRAAAPSAEAGRAAL